MESIHLSIVTPLGEIFNGDVKSVTLPGTEGEFGVLPLHVGLLTTLEPGVIEIELKKDYKESVAIKWGSAEISETRIDVLVDEAVAIRGDSDSEISKAISDAKALLHDVKESGAMLASAEIKLESNSRQRI